MIDPIPPLVPTDRMAHNTRPTPTLPDGPEGRLGLARTQTETGAVRTITGRDGVVGPAARRPSPATRHPDRRGSRARARRDGCRVLPAGRGGGITTEAARRLGDRAPDEPGPHRLPHPHADADESPCGVVEKAGFRLEGAMRHALRHADGRRDRHLHARVRDTDRKDEQ